MESCRPYSTWLRDQKPIHLGASPTMPPQKAARRGQLYGLSQLAGPEMALAFPFQGTKFWIPNALAAVVTL
jgi:hypothetical protein